MPTHTLSIPYHTTCQQVLEQLYQLVHINSVRIVDLFHDWDVDGNGKIEKKEFIKAFQGLLSQASAAAAPRPHVRQEQLTQPTILGKLSGPIW